MGIAYRARLECDCACGCAFVAETSWRQLRPSWRWRPPGWQRELHGEICPRCASDNPVRHHSPLGEKG